ncbi:enolase C-terminal domain-like protein [Luteitalea sp.]|jgi:L-alanine-DL-glutamate epimerase-like enolase superfamily enzyme|uniref:enolase C-terminal domain-like protein n=1 Tax=Luteitalea sp. TaxID=2004800 RepID=UPI0037CB24B4
MTTWPRLPTRRAVLRAAGAALPLASIARAAQAPAVRASRPTDIRVVDVMHAFEGHTYRAPYMFGGRSVDRVTILNVQVRVRTGDGKEAFGFGSMTLGNAWAFPKASQDEGLGAMTALAEAFRAITAACDDQGHPIDLWRVLEPAYLQEAAALGPRRGLAMPIPKLCTLVVASAFDAAIHDAYGKAFGLSSYATYSSRHMRHDLSRDLGPAFAGQYLDRHVAVAPRAETPVFHSVGASDAIEPSDLKVRLDDGLPNTLAEWIARDGLTHFKIKLNGGNEAQDFDRITRIDRVVREAMTARRIADWHYLLDFNEGCPNVGYLLTLLRKVREFTPDGFARIKYVEQPTSRDLAGDRANVMHEASKLLPVVVDEGLVDIESLHLARAMGYTGVALKACKGQSQALLIAAAAQQAGMFLCVQDLTCPGASLIHSAGIAARVPGNAGIEANARQFVPSASAAWEPRFPGLFTVRNGVMRTGQLTGPGLGAVPPGPRLA